MELKKVIIVTTWSDGTNKQISATDLNYTGSPNVTAYSVSGTIAFPSGATIPSGSYLGIFAENSGGTKTPCNIAHFIVVLTAASTQSFTLSGLANGSTYNIFAQTTLDWKTSSYVHWGEPSFTVPYTGAIDITMSASSN